MPIVGSGSLFEVVDFQARGADQLLNRYWYYGSFSPDTVASGLVANAFESIFAAWLPPVQPDVISHPTITVDEVTSISNFLERLGAIPDGTLLPPELASYQCAGIRLLRTTKETRSGWKRIAAGNEDSIGGNNWGPSFQGELDNLAGVMNDALSVGGFFVDPVIIRKTVDPVTGDPEPPSDWIYNLVASAEAKTVVTTQNTRKVGRGS